MRVLGLEGTRSCARRTTCDEAVAASLPLAMYADEPSRDSKRPLGKRVPSGGSPRSCNGLSNVGVFHAIRVAPRDRAAGRPSSWGEKWWLEPPVGRALHSRAPGLAPRVRTGSISDIAARRSVAPPASPSRAVLEPHPESERLAVSGPACRRSKIAVSFPLFISTLASRIDPCNLPLNHRISLISGERSAPSHRRVGDGRLPEGPEAGTRRLEVRAAVR